jgi:hypothetical protein
MKKAAFSSRFIMLYMPLHGGFILMSAVAFDTLKFAEKLQSGGFTPEQSKVVSYAFAEATGEQLVTRQVLKDELAPIEQKIANLKQEITLVKADVAVLKWMSGFTLAAVMAIFYLMLRQH